MRAIAGQRHVSSLAEWWKFFSKKEITSFLLIQEVRNNSTATRGYPEKSFLPISRCYYFLLIRRQVTRHEHQFLPLCRNPLGSALCASASEKSNKFSNSSALLFSLSLSPSLSSPRKSNCSLLIAGNKGTEIKYRSSLPLPRRMLLSYFTYIICETCLPASRTF